MCSLPWVLSYSRSNHAMRSIAEVQKAEAADVEKARATNERRLWTQRRLETQVPLTC